MKVPARIHSDDELFEITVDASAWLKTLDAKTLKALANQEWQNCEEADEFARWVEQEADFSSEEGKTIADMFTYLGLVHKYGGNRRPWRDGGGFEVEIDGDKAEALTKVEPD